MGLLRKMTSVSTLGLIDFRSAKDRTAAHTATAAREAKKQTRLMRQQVSAAPVVAQLPPPGFYPDGQGATRWWDGRQFTGFVQP